MPDTEIELLTPKLQDWIRQQHWNDLHPVQKKALRPILQGGTDVIISAATASGKTEAAFLPACSQLADHPVTGCGILCLSPLKALINDQARRLSDICAPLGIPVTPWHGDIARERKQQFWRNPDGILLITPESLETFYMRHASWCRYAFQNLSRIIVDEFHAFAFCERGWQLSSLLRRTDVTVGHPVPRIALSATLGNIEETPALLRPSRNGYPCVIIEDKTTKVKPIIQIRGYKTQFLRSKIVQQRTSRLARDLFALLEGGKHLVFANSRTRTEQLVRELSTLCNQEGLDNEFFPHHGNLSRNLRSSLEKRMLDPEKPATAVCTATLELGIDIGSVDSIAQIAAPGSVSSLRQRLGRSGRRGDRPLLRLFITERELTEKNALWDKLRLEMFQTIAMIQLLEQQWYEPVEDTRGHYSTLVQQVLSTISQFGRILPSQLFSLLCGTGPFPADSEKFVLLLKGLSSCDLLHSGDDHRIILTEKGLSLTRELSFTAAFETPEEYTLKTDDAFIGTLPAAEPLEKGQHILFAGKSWKVSKISEDGAVLLEPARDGVPPRFSGQGAEIHDRVRQEMFRIYCSSKEIPGCDAGAMTLFREGRTAFAELGLKKRPLLAWGTKTCMLPWLGDKTVRTLTCLMRMEGLEADCYNGIVLIRDMTPSAVLRTIRKLLAGSRPTAQAIVKNLPGTLYEKFDKLVTPVLRDADAAQRYYCLDGAWNWMTELSEKAKK